MSDLSTKITLYAKSKGVNSINFLEDVKLRDLNDGNGAYIFEWNLEIAEPTTEELNSFETNGNLVENNYKIIATRKNLYGSWDKQLEEINEQGLDAWKERIAQIKADNPKES